MLYTLYTLLLAIGFVTVLILSAEDSDGPNDDQRGGGGGGRKLAKVPVRTRRR